MSGIFSVPPKICHRRLRQARGKANQAASGQRREVASLDLTIACANAIAKIDRFFAEDVVLVQDQQTSQLLGNKTIDLMTDDDGLHLTLN